MHIHAHKHINNIKIIKIYQHIIIDVTRSLRSFVTDVCAFSLCNYVELQRDNKPVEVLSFHGFNSSTKYGCTSYPY